MQTIADIGHAELAEVLATQRLVAAPPGLPDDIKRVLGQAIQDALSDPKFMARAEKAEVTPKPLNAEETTEVVNETVEKLSEYRGILTEAIGRG